MQVALPHSDSAVTIKTNNVPRLVLEGYELLPAERAEFDYIDWEAIERGEDSASFGRYKGTLYDLGNIERSTVPGWDGMAYDSFFSGILLRYCADTDYVVFARWYC